MNKKIGYILEHVYERDEIEEIKHIGVFSSLEKAKAAIEQLKVQPGFNEHPVDCFCIDKIIIDEYEWKEGFENTDNWDDTNEV